MSTFINLHPIYHLKAYDQTVCKLSFIWECLKIRQKLNLVNQTETQPKKFLATCIGLVFCFTKLTTLSQNKAKPREAYNSC